MLSFLEFFEMAKKNSLQVFKKIIATTIIMSNMFACTAQNKNISKQKRMKTFDIENFERKKDTNNLYIYKDGDTIVTQKKWDNNAFDETKFQKNQKNKTRRYIYYFNGNLGGGKRKNFWI